MKTREITTVVIGPDGRVFDLARRPFPRRHDYIPVNAYTIPVNDLRTEERGRDDDR